MKIKDLAKGDLENKGLMKFDLENKRVMALLASGCAVRAAKNEFVILKTKDLAKGNLENKGLTQIDLENKGVNFRAQSAGLRAQKDEGRGFVAAPSD